MEPKFESNLDLKQKEKRKDSNLQRTTHEKSISLQHTTHEKSIDQLTNRLFLFSILPFSINSKTENIKVSPLNWQTKKEQINILHSNTRYVQYISQSEWKGE